MSVFGGGVLQHLLQHFFSTLLFLKGPYQKARSHHLGQDRDFAFLPSEGSLYVGVLMMLVPR